MDREEQIGWRQQSPGCQIRSEEDKLQQVSKYISSVRLYLLPGKNLVNVRERRDERGGALRRWCGSKPMIEVQIQSNFRGVRGLLIGRRTAVRTGMAHHSWLALDPPEARYCLLPDSPSHTEKPMACFAAYHPAQTAPKETASCMLHTLSTCSHTRASHPWRYHHGCIPVAYEMIRLHARRIYRFPIPDSNMEGNLTTLGIIHERVMQWAIGGSFPILVILMPAEIKNHLNLDYFGD